MPAFFGNVYNDEKLKNLYFLLNAFVVSIGGFASAMTGGYVSDKYEKKYPRIKAIVCIIGSGLGLPTIAMATLIQNNFALSMVGLFLEYLVAECWSSPAITMLLNAISPQNKGFAVSAYLFFTTISGTISTFLLG
jgi:MFS family permease